MNKAIQLEDAQFKEEMNRWLAIFALSILMGIIGGIFAVLLRYLIEEIQYIFHEILLPQVTIYVGSFNFGLILIPTIGGLIVGLIVQFFSKETKGSGIPLLLKKMTLEGAHINAKVGIYKTLTSALTIGTGGNAGKEGPIALIAASFGSFFGTKLKLRNIDKRLLMTCGLAAGISGSFNAPLGGALFGMEILFQGVSIIGSIPVFLASSIGTVIAGYFFNYLPTFIITSEHTQVNDIEFIFIIILGIFIAFIAFLRSKLYSKIDHSYTKLSWPPFLKTTLGGFIVGTIIMFFPGVGLYGSGFDGIQLALDNNFTFPLTMLLLGFLKFIATSNTIGSGGSGGVFAPILYIGCMLGGFYGLILEIIFPNLPINPTFYCLLGAAALFSASALAPLNISIMLSEMTQDFALFPPLLIISVVSFFIGQILTKGTSIYTKTLEKEGIGMKMDTILKLEKTRVHEIMTSNLITVSPNLPILELAQVSAQNNDLKQFPVINFGTLNGIVFIDSLYSVPYENWDEITVKEIMSTDITGVHADETLQIAIDLMHKKNTKAILVTDEIEKNNEEKEIIIKGILTFEDIVRAWKQSKVRK